MAGARDYFSTMQSRPDCALSLQADTHGVGNLNTCNCKIKSHWMSTTPAAATDRKHEDELSSQDIKSVGTQQHPPPQGTCMHTWYVPCMFTVLQRRVDHAVDNSTEDGVAEEDG